MIVSHSLFPIAPVAFLIVSLFDASITSAFSSQSLPRISLSSSFHSSLYSIATPESSTLSTSDDSGEEEVEGVVTENNYGTSSLIAPMELSEMSDTVFDENVYKTYGRYPITISRGEGCTLYTPEGKRYLDFVAGIATCGLGHAPKALTEAIETQMKSLHHVSNLYYIPQQAALAKWLVDNSCADKVFFCNSGAEANEGAIKLARKSASLRGITDPIIITAINSFHGRTLAAVSATAQPKYHKGFTYGGEMVRGFKSIPYNDPEGLEKLVKKMSKTPLHLKIRGRKRGVAAIMLETLQGEGGIVPGTQAFFSKARELCDTHSSLLICDEVQVGMGRSGTLWGYEQLDLTPDVFTSAKALGGGVPIGALMAKGAASTVFKPGDHASTYGGNPLACAAGLAVAKEMSNPGFLENVKQRGEQLGRRLDRLVEMYPKIFEATRGWGLLRGIVMRDDADGCSWTAGDLVGKATEEGLLLVPAGLKVVRFVPPLIVTEKEVDTALDMFERAVIALASSK